MIQRFLAWLWDVIASALGRALMPKEIEKAQQRGQDDERKSNADAGEFELMRAKNARENMAGELCDHPDLVRQPDANSAGRGSDGIS